MGSGNWTTTAYCNYMNSRGFETKTAVNSKGVTYAVSDDVIVSNVQDFYRARGLAEELNPFKVIRECRDSEEHPNTVPVIFALDVTGSMGNSAKVCAGKLDEIMTSLYGEVDDIEFMMMAIGDLIYDGAPVQATQFESDIRILDQTSKIYFEGGGGPNPWESYTAAWYFGLNNTDLDCWKRGKKGIIITIGDECLNPDLPYPKIERFIGDNEQGVFDTKKLYELASEKFDIYHIGITDSTSRNYERSGPYKGGAIRDSWTKIIGQGYFECKADELPKVIEEIVKDSVGRTTETVMTEATIKW